MYIDPGQGQTAPRGQSFDGQQKVLSFHSFVASFKEISLTSDFIQDFWRFNTYVDPGQKHTAPRGQSFDVNRNVLYYIHLLQVSKKCLQSLILYNITIFYMYIAPGQSFDVYRNFLSLRSSVATSFKS